MLVPVLWLALPESVRFLALGKGNEMRIASILKRVAPDRAAAGRRYFASEQGPVFARQRLFDPDYRRGTLLLWLAFFMSLLLLYMLINWLPILGARSGSSLKQASVFAGLLQGGGVLGAIVLGVMIDRFDAYKVVSAAYLIGAAAVASLAVAGSAWWLAACIFLTGFCVSGSRGLRECHRIGFLSDIEPGDGRGLGARRRANRCDRGIVWWRVDAVSGLVQRSALISSWQSPRHCPPRVSSSPAPVERG